MIYSLVSSVVAFIATNIDDMFINMLLFASAKEKKDNFAIVLGKYLGTGALVAVSVMAGFGAQAIIGDYIHLLGVVPIFLGLKEIYSNIKGSDDEQISIGGKYVLSTALITVANGADNVGVYVPLFAQFSAYQLAVMVVVFCVMTALWCFLGKMVTNLPVIKNIMEKYSVVITPLVYISLGVYILFF